MPGFSPSIETPRLQIIASIIERSRRVQQASRLADAELGKTALAWDEICRRIPTLTLEETYLACMETRSRAGPLQAQELLDLWNSRHLIEKQRQHQGQVNITPDCRYCDDQGWQIIRFKEGLYGTGRRACECSRAPSAYRSDRAFSEPVWERNVRGEWQRAI
jgi:hypothetical protein